MPIYEFKCNDCGDEFSEIRRMGDDKGVACPQCRSIHTKKLISTFASISGSESPGCPSVSQCSHAGGG
jgi:putative FmdB family regulatory protein